MSIIKTVESWFRNSLHDAVSGIEVNIYLQEIQLFILLDIWNVVWEPKPNKIWIVSQNTLFDAKQQEGRAFVTKILNTNFNLVFYSPKPFIIITAPKTATGFLANKMTPEFSCSICMYLCHSFSHLVNIWLLNFSVYTFKVIKK